MRDEVMRTGIARGKRKREKPGGFSLSLKARSYFFFATFFALGAAFLTAFLTTFLTAFLATFFFTAM